MSRYDPSAPLIFIHVPKTGGASVRRVFEGWFPALIPHYFDARAKRMPERRQLGPGDVVYGHFNHLRGFGVADYYPEVRQFMTILRDPFEMAVSSWFYRHRPAQQARRGAGGTLEDIVTAPLNMLNQFPVEVSEANYRDVVSSFLFVGITERMEESLRRIAALLGKPQVDAGRNNAGERTQPYAQLRPEFERNHRLECEVYRHAAALMSQE